MLKSTSHQVTVNIADMDHYYYSEANLVLVQNHSEIPECLMLRLLAWLYHTDELLEFIGGLSAEDKIALRLSMELYET